MKIRNSIIAICFFVFLGYSACVTRFYQGFANQYSAVLDTFKQRVEEGIAPEEEKQRDDGTTYMHKVTLGENLSPALKTISDTMLLALPYKNNLIDVGGVVLKAAGTRSFYNNTYGMNITTTGYNVSGDSVDNTTDYEVDQTLRLKKYLDKKEIPLLYVSEPAKYIDDEFFFEQFGKESYMNRDTDEFLARIREQGMDCLDLRDTIREENIDPLSLFYRTDHHWTVPASKWAAKTIAQKLNDDYGYKIDLSMYDDDKYEIVEYKNAWLGEHGRKVAKSYIGMDDYTMMEPKFPTAFKIYDSGNQVVKQGDFGIFIDKSRYNTRISPYDSPSWHYSYLASNYTCHRIHNEKAKKGHILVLGDSYESSMIPFLSLGVSDVTLLVHRGDDLPNIREYVESGKYDMVIIAYAQFMIGAHDYGEAGANYKMFAFDDM